LEASLGGKWLELLSEIAPGLKRAVIMFNPAPASSFMPLLDPSGNVTGFGGLEPSLGGKWLELLSEIAPGLKRAAIMFNPDAALVSTYMPSFETAARSLKVEAITTPVHSDVEIETAIIALGREPGGGLVVIADAVTTVHRRPIILAAARNNVPASIRILSLPETAACSPTEPSG
jgi:putative ABC transport system substrate-binding protein